MKNKYDCVVVDIPKVFQDTLGPAVDNLPYISLITAHGTEQPFYYVPIDPCDPAIEGVRQSRQNHIPFYCAGYPELSAPEPLPSLPDEHALHSIQFDRYAALCLYAVGNPDEGSMSDNAAQYFAYRLHQIRTEHTSILALVHLRHFSRTVYHFFQEKTYNLSFGRAPSYTHSTNLVNPDHLYFALGELPFVTGKFEKERFDLFSEGTDSVEILKDLFRETRDEYMEDQERLFELSPSRIQIALQFLRNLTIRTGYLLPSLFDIVASAKGVGGNTYALQVLKNARYYPYLPYEAASPMVNVGIDRIVVPNYNGPQKAINLFRDITLEWRTLSIKPDPTLKRKEKYRYTWNPLGMCSHVPEDIRIERFNAYLRSKALRILSEDFVKTEKFSTSVKDGIDIRETLRNWFTENVYVKELPPQKGYVDTVVIIFDDSHDDRYPHTTTWYAEHNEESTLTFYATDPFSDMIGPGIARCYYGGLSLLFPPRSIPSAFTITKNMGLPNLASRLTFGAVLFSQEKSVAYVANRKPSALLRSIAARHQKHLVWIPLNHFSTETLRQVRRFHILNGKKVRSWASRFIVE